MNNILEVKNLSFHYDEYDIRTGSVTEGKKGLNNISFSIPAGSFVTLCGSTGSGKSTLLKLLKRDVITAGKTIGDIYLNGTNIKELDAAAISSAVGLLFQNPEDQIVTDKVWHEIAFGLENLGLSQAEMESRLAESLAFFRLEGISRNDTAALSGGQKQLVSLASVLAMYPGLLLLDEPTSQLDPEACEHYISTIKKLQSSLGLTVIIAEHNLDKLLPVSDMLMVMENGELLCCDTVDNALTILSKTDSGAKSDLPLPTRYGISINASSLPLDINQGRKLLMSNKDMHIFGTASSLKVAVSSPEAASSPKNGLSPEATASSTATASSKPLVKLNNVCFKYSHSGNDVLNDFSASFDAGCCYAILGCNASGKSTLLKLLSGSIKPQLGRITPKPGSIKIAYMPQDTDNMFIAETIEKELLAVGLKPDCYPEYISHIDRSAAPMDLSGGEKQLLGLAKVSALKPELLLLDEPTKGTDNISRCKMLNALNDLKQSGTAIIMACHDMTFAAECADKCAILSMGRLTGLTDCKTFFTTNRLYTTPTRTMTVGIIDDCYLERDILRK